MTRSFHHIAIWAFALLSLPMAAGAAGEAKTLNVLFIGNSFTARHNLSTVVKAMAEAGLVEIVSERYDAPNRLIERITFARLR